MSKILAKSQNQRYEQIRKKAATLFSQLGYSTTSMKIIAESLGIEAPSLYNHIKNKNQLLYSICNYMGKLVLENVAAIKKQNIPAIEKLKAILDFHIEQMIINADDFYVANHEWKQLETNERAIFKSSRILYEQEMMDIILIAKQEKSIDENIDERITMLTLLSALRGLEFLRKEQKGKNKNELKEQVAHQLLNGLIKK